MALVIYSVIANGPAIIATVAGLATYANSPNLRQKLAQILGNQRISRERGMTQGK